jgi:hypothetical protein
VRPDPKDIIDPRAEDIIEKARVIIEGVASMHSDRWGPDALESQPEDLYGHDVRGKAWDWLLEYSERMPEDVAEYFTFLLTQPPRGPVSKRTRDKILAQAISDVCWYFGLNPTRNRSKHGSREGLSGCGAVAMALAELGRSIEEEAVQAIWFAQKDSVIPVPDRLAAWEARQAIVRKK